MERFIDISFIGIIAIVAVAAVVCAIYATCSFAKEAVDDWKSRQFEFSIMDVIQLFLVDVTLFFVVLLLCITAWVVWR